MFYIVTGHYGSGKTEVALNLAFNLKNPIIIDLDIVNPFFRTKDAEEKLKEKGIRLIAPQYANTNVDLPTLPPDIYGALQSDNDVIIDVGGDDDGAVALGQYNRFFTEKPYEMIFVINTKRPSTSNADDIINMIHAVEQASRLKVTSLINNTNIKGETTIEDVIDGQKIVNEVAYKTNLPIKAVTGKIDIINQIKTDVQKMPLDLHLLLPWEV